MGGFTSPVGAGSSKRNRIPIVKTIFAQRPVSARRLFLPGLWVLLASLLWGAAIPLRAADNDADQILGTWLTENGASKIQITATNDIYSGTLVWLAPRPNNSQAGATGKAKAPRPVTRR